MSTKKHTADLLRQYYDEYRLKLFNFCLARLSGERESADDCVQEAFLILNRKLLDGEEIQNPRAFLYRTAENFVKRRQEQITKEKNRLMSIEEAENTISSEDDYFYVADKIDYETLAKRMIENLDDREIQLYNLRYTDKRRVDEIAEILKISRPAASMRLMRLRDKIIEMVRETDFEKGDLQYGG